MSLVRSVLPLSTTTISPAHAMDSRQRRMVASLFRLMMMTEMLIANGAVLLGSRAGRGGGQHRAEKQPDEVPLRKRAEVRTEETGQAPDGQCPTRQPAVGACASGKKACYQD